jgi:hypothetical protein
LDQKNLSATCIADDSNIPPAHHHAVKSRRIINTWPPGTFLCWKAVKEEINEMATLRA